MVALIVGYFFLVVLGVCAWTRLFPKTATSKSLSPTDAELLKAIQEGTLGVKDLQEAGFDKAVDRAPQSLDEVSPTLRMIKGARTSSEVRRISEIAAEACRGTGALARQTIQELEEKLARAKLKWEPRPTRALFNHPLENWVQGEELWIRPSSLFYDTRGIVHLSGLAVGQHCPMMDFNVRVRVWAPEAWEVSVPCGADMAFNARVIPSDLSCHGFRPVVHMTQYANTRYAGGDPKNRFRLVDQSSEEYKTLIYGKGVLSYVVPFYPHDKKKNFDDEFDAKAADRFNEARRKEIRIKTKPRVGAIKRPRAPYAPYKG